MQEEKMNNHKIKEYSAKMVSPVLSFIDLIMVHPFKTQYTYLKYSIKKYNVVQYMSTNTPINIINV